MYMYSYHVNRIPCCLVKFSFRPIGYNEAQEMLRVQLVTSLSGGGLGPEYMLLLPPSALGIPQFLS